MIITKDKYGNEDIEYTREEIEQLAETLSQNSSLHTNSRDALRRVCNGELEGTIFASKLCQYFFLLGEWGQ
jgi:hypothetical protein